MCEALEEIYLKVHGERLKREQQEAVDKAVAEAVTEAVDKAVAEAVDKAVAEAVAEKDAYIKILESQLKITTS